MTRPSPGSWRSLFAVALVAALVVAAAEIGFRRVAPVTHLSEVEDAIAALERSDPTVLVLGSSHARTWEVTGPELARRTGGRERLLAVPVEFGKLASYEWTWRNRIVPLLDETAPDGRRVRPSLRRVVLVTEWWDSCPPPEGPGPATNLPSRAWRFADFVRDVSRHGVTDFNRNWLTTRWLRMGWGSILVQDRGHGRILEGLKSLVRPPGPDDRRAALAFQRRKWRRAVEDGAHQLLDPSEMAALGALLDSFRDRGLETTIVLYPRKPDTITDAGRTGTLEPFAVAMRRIAAGRGLPLYDWSLSAPIGDEHFLDDFDHLSAEGNRIMADWMLDGDLASLLEPSDAASAPGIARAGEDAQ